jgi:isopenicillin N synthase-like dioxygenase
MSLPISRPVTAEDCPVIDLARMHSGDKADFRRIAMQITEASRNLGFFYVINHGMPPAQIDEMLALGKRFFALPLEEKMAIRLALSDNYRGYLPMKMMGADPSLKGNLHEGFQIHKELPPDDPDVLAGKPLHGPNQWPSSMPEFRPKVMEYYNAMTDLSFTFLKMFAMGLDLPQDSFTRFFSKPMMQFRYLRYPAQEPTDSGDHLGTRPHTDSGAFTFLAQDDIGGLEILNRQREWIAVPPIEGAYVVNIGEAMKIWTDGVLVSTPHRVINRYGQERFSMPFFATPDFDAELHPIFENPSKEALDTEPVFATSVERGKPVTCGEVLVKLYGRIWPSTRMQRVD